MSIIIFKVPFTEEVKISFSEILTVNVFSRLLLERINMHGSILIENISFSRNCHIKTTNCEGRHGRFCLGKVYLQNIATRSQ